MNPYKINKECDFCKKGFLSWKCQDRKFCSQKCYWGAMKVQKRYKEQNLQTLIDYSKTKKARIANSKRQKGKAAWNKGRPMPEITGSNHYLWKEDRTTLVKSEKKHLDGRYREWVWAVKSRDKWCCKINNEDCNGRLEAHHILRWKDHPKLRYDVNNGISLCKAHHPIKKTEEAKMIPTFKELIS